jgi:hypothetical protein
MYQHLFTVEEVPDATWEEVLNPTSEIVMRNALIDPSVMKWNPQNESHFQVFLSKRIAIYQAWY